MIAGNIEIQLLANVARLQQDMNQARRTVESAVDNMAAAAARAKAAFAGITSGIGLSQLVDMVDQYGKFTAQLRLATLSSREYALAYGDVKRIATVAQQDLQATGMLYARIANGTRELGLAQKQVAAITETVNLSLKVSGATAEESASAQLQLSQAFAAGALRGEEFNAVNEAAPRLMQALADGIGVPVGALKKMAEEGEITSAIMAKVLPNALAKLREEAKEVQSISGAFTVLMNNVMEFVGVQANASGSVSVLTRAIGGLANNLETIANTGLLVAAVFGGKLVASIIESAKQKLVDVAASRAQALANEEAAATALRRAQAERQAALVAQSRARETVATVQAEVAADRQRVASAAAAAEQEIVARQSQYVATANIVRQEIALEQSRLAAQINSIGRAQRVAEMARLAGELAAIERAIAAQSTALTAQRVANEQAVANAAAVGAARIAAARAAETTATGVAAAATLQARTAQVALTAAMAATSLASRVLGGALALLGGPIGAVTLAVTLGITAWTLWGNKVGDESKKATAAVEESTAEMIARLDKQIEKLRERNRLQGEEPRLQAIGQISEADLAGLARAKAALDAVQNATGSWTNVPAQERQLAAIDLAYEYETALTKVRQAQDETTAAAARTRNARLEEWYGQNGTSAQKLAAELEKLRKEFGTIPPEMEKLVRAKYVDPSQKAALKEHNQALKEAADWYRQTTQAGADEIAMMRQELDAVNELTPVQREAIKVRQEMDRLGARISPQQRKIIDGQLAEKLAIEQTSLEREHYQNVMKSAFSASATEIAAAESRVAALQKEVEQYGLAEDAIMRVTLAELNRKLAATDDAVEQDRLFRLIAATEDQLELQTQLTKLKANTEFWKSLDDTARDTFRSIEDGGKGIWQRIKESAQNVFFDWLYQMTAKKWILNLQASADGGGAGGIVSAIGGALGSGGGDGSGMGSMMNLLSMGKSLYSMFTGGLVSSLGSAVTSLGTTFGSAAVAEFGAGMSGVAGTGLASGSAAGMGASFANAIPIIGWIISGMMASNSFFKQGYDIHNGTVKDPLGLGSGIRVFDNVLRGIGLSDSLANIFSGQAVVGKLFGRAAPRIESQGLSGEFNNGGVLAENWANVLEKGGVFRSDKRYTVKQGADAEFAQGLTETFAQMKGAAGSLADVLGVSTEGLDSFRYAFNITFDADETKREQQITDMLAGLGDAMATYLVPNIAAFSAEGETATTTLQRLATEFANTNTIMQAIGVDGAQAFGAVGLASIEARERLMSMAGGVDALAQQTDYFAQNFMTEAERLVPVQKAVVEQMAALGYAGVTTNDQYKDVVLGLASSGALATEAGAKTYAALLALAPTFKTVADAAAAAREKTASLEEQIFALTHTDGEVLARQREAELAALSATDRALQLRIYALQDEAAAAAATATALESNETSLRAFVDSAMDAVQRAVEAQRKAVQAAYERGIAALQVRIDGVNTTIATLNDLASVLKNGLSSMTMQGTESATRASAQAQIEAALAIARAGGVLPTADSIRDAVGLASKTSTDDFASFIEYQRDFVRTSSALAELAGLTDGQLTDAQRQLAALNAEKDLLEDWYKGQTEALDEALEKAQQQIDATNGVNTSVLSVAQALGLLAASIAGYKAGATPSNPAGTGITLEELYQSVLGRAPDAAGAAYWSAVFGDSIDEADIRNFVNGAAGELAGRVPGFAAGGDHVGGWRIVGENGPEAEYTPPSRIHSNAATTSMFDGMEQRIESLEKTMAVGLSRLIGETKRGADAMEDVSDKGIKTRSETEVS